MEIAKVLRMGARWRKSKTDIGIQKRIRWKKQSIEKYKHCERIECVTIIRQCQDKHFTKRHRYDRGYGYRYPISSFECSKTWTPLRTFFLSVSCLAVTEVSSSLVSHVSLSGVFTPKPFAVSAISSQLPSFPTGFSCDSTPPTHLVKLLCDCHISRELLSTREKKPL